MPETESNDAWLGLLKWSLNYVDGTVPSEESEGFKKMSAADKAFLEDVMKNGIINEGERMKTILSSLVEFLDKFLKEKNTDGSFDSDGSGKGTISSDEAIEMLNELQDIVEQIDYARSFAALGGIKFLLGCSAKEVVEKDIRVGCLSVLSTMCQNNPPVQLMMLEQGSILQLTVLYFKSHGTQQQEQDERNILANNVLRAKIVQVLSSSIRNHETAENLFYMNKESVLLIESGLAANHDQLKRKTLFFLQALVTSDTSNLERVRMFTKAIQYVAHNFLDPALQNNQDLREMALSMLCRILEQKKSIDCILDVKNSIVGIGVKQISYLRSLKSVEKEIASEELLLWESLIQYIART